MSIFIMAGIPVPINTTTNYGRKYFEGHFGHSLQPDSLTVACCCFFFISKKAKITKNPPRHEVLSWESPAWCVSHQGSTVLWAAPNHTDFRHICTPLNMILQFQQQIQRKTLHCVSKVCCIDYEKNVFLLLSSVLLVYCWTESFGT